MNKLLDLYINIFNSTDFARVKDHTNILIAAGYWEEDRYNAAKVFYKLMRKIDDLVDNRKATGQKITADEAQRYSNEVNEWIRRVFEGGDRDDTELRELSETIKRFRVPSWPMEYFARSMVYDLNNDGFATLDSFLEYSKGASLAPASVFLHFAGLSLHNGVYAAPEFDVKEESLPCAYFSYLVHIIRDFQKDQLNNLNYFADDMIAKHGLTRKKLSEVAHGAPVPDGFRSLMRDYYDMAGVFMEKTGEGIRRIWPSLQPRYRLSLEIVFELYRMVFEKIDIEKGNFSSEELNPTIEETRNRVYKTITGSRTLQEIP